MFASFFPPVNYIGQCINVTNQDFFIDRVDNETIQKILHIKYKYMQ